MTPKVDRPLVSVVLPCLNEAGCLERLLPTVPSIVSEVVVVDNGSIDETAHTARRLGALVVSEPRRGMGHAHRRGLAAASGEVIVCLDGDATYPVEGIPALIDRVKRDGLDFLSCCRFPLTHPDAMSQPRRVGNRALTLLANRLFGLRLQDLMSGMWVLRRGILPLLRLREGGVAICVEIKLRAFLHPGITAAETRIPYLPRLAGKSKLVPWRDGMRCLRFLWKARDRWNRRVTEAGVRGSHGGER